MDFSDGAVRLNTVPALLRPCSVNALRHPRSPEYRGQTLRNGKLAVGDQDRRNPLVASGSTERMHGTQPLQVRRPEFNTNTITKMTLAERPEDSDPSIDRLLQSLREAECVDSADHWPAEQLAMMRDAGVFRWNIPVAMGGLEFGSSAMIRGLRRLSSACLTTTFIMTQRNAACSRILSSANQSAVQSLMPDLVRGRRFATVGISHLTTSRRHLRTAAVSAEIADSGIVKLDGVIPWATGATHSDLIITGGTLSDGTEVLVGVDRSQEGVEVLPPADLLALNASQTGAVRLQNVCVPADRLLHGPVKGVMSSGTGGGAGSLGTSALAIGAAERSVCGLESEAERRPELASFAEQLRKEWTALESDLMSAAAGSHSAGDVAPEVVRRQANSLVVRAAQSWLAATKGAGFAEGHPAQRAVRESMFFLVWSCPQPVLMSNLGELACR